MGCRTAMLQNLFPTHIVKHGQRPCNKNIPPEQFRVLNTFSPHASSSRSEYCRHCHDMDGLSNSILVIRPITVASLVGAEIQLEVVAYA
jgi:hypothetical protein